MTLRNFLKKSGLSLSNNHETGLGDKVAQKFRAKYKYTPEKKFTKEVGHSVIDYPDGFLDTCEDLIIKFLTDKNQSINA